MLRAHFNLSARVSEMSETCERHRSFEFSLDVRKMKFYTFFLLLTCANSIGRFERKLFKETSKKRKTREPKNEKQAMKKVSKQNKKQWRTEFWYQKIA